MKMRQLVVLFVCLSYFFNAESQSQGIKFERGLTWEQIILKAKNESKFVFVDCYATWCKPCKEMDKQVFTDAAIEKLMSERFISVKIQMDSTKSDDKNIRKLFPTARQFEKLYNIAALPTFLFFSSDGKLVHREIGKMEVNRFVSLANDAINPEKQLYTLIEKWKDGQLENNKILQLSETLKKYHEDSLSLEVARDYMLNYLDKLSDNELLQKENLDFLRQNAKMIRTKDRVFEMLYNDKGKVDNVINNSGYSKRFADYIIYNSEIFPYLMNVKNNKQKPDWRQLTNQIKSKFSGKDAIKYVIEGKVNWYKDKKDWKNYTKALFQKTKIEDLFKLPLDEGTIAFYINGRANDFFTYSNKKKELKLALMWSNYAISKASSNIASLLDTKANLLYKLKRKDEALRIYKKVIELYPDYTVFYECIQNDLPTWSKAIWPRAMERKKDEAKDLQNQVRKQRSKPIDEYVTSLEFSENPDFSGKWEINYFKSEFNYLPGYAASKRFVICSKPDSILIEKFNIDGPDVETYSKLNFSLDGNEKISINNKGQIQSVIASWSDDRRILKTVTILKSAVKINQIEIKRTQKWALLNDGKTLIVQQLTDVEGNSNPYSIIAVYNRN
jgi:thiol-disulfide isomerase/thioredoxin